MTVSPLFPTTGRDYPIIEEHGSSPREAYEGDGASRFERTFLVPFVNRIGFVQNLLLDPADRFETPVPIGGLYNRPSVYNVDDPQWANAYCVSARVQPFQERPYQSGDLSFDDPGSFLPSHDAQARVVATYETQYWDDEYAAFIEVTSRSSIEILQLPGRTLKYETSGNAVEDVNFGTMILVRDYNVIWRRAMAPKWETLHDLIGSVNSEPFRIPGTTTTVQKECVLLADVQDSPRYDVELLLHSAGVPSPRFEVGRTNGWEVADIGMTFRTRVIRQHCTNPAQLYQPLRAVGGSPTPPTGAIGWNHGWDETKSTPDEATGLWDRVVTATTQPDPPVPPYPLKDLKDAFNSWIDDA